MELDLMLTLDLKLLFTSLCTKSNLERSAVSTESSSGCIEMQSECVIGWKGQLKVS